MNVVWKTLSTAIVLFVSSVIVLGLYWIMFSDSDYALLVLAIALLAGVIWFIPIFLFVIGLFFLANFLKSRGWYKVAIFMTVAIVFATLLFWLVAFLLFATHDDDLPSVVETILGAIIGGITAIIYVWQDKKENEKVVVEDLVTEDENIENL